MGIDARNLSRLLGLLYEGLAFPERWQEFLSEAARQLGCDKAAIVFHDPQNQKPDMGFYTGLSEGAMREYNLGYGSKNPITRPILDAVKANGEWHGLARDVVGAAEYSKSEYYQGWGRKNGVYHAVVGMAGGGTGTSTSLSVMRSEVHGPLGQDAIALMGLLIPHLRRAFQIHKQMETLRISASGAHSAMDALETAVIAIKNDGSVASLNRRAEDLLRKKNGGITLRQGRLEASEPSQTAELDWLVRRAALTGAGRSSYSGGAILLHRGAGAAALPVSVAPFHSSHLFTEDSPCALLFIQDPAGRPASRAKVLAALYGLTPAECRLADLMLEEAEPSAAAARMKITVNTARFMLKSIFHKTGTRRQAQLIRLLMSLPGDAGAAEPRKSHS